jgi:hypothetical protein
MQNSVAISSSQMVRNPGFAVSTRPARCRLWIKKSETRLTGPVNRGDLFKVDCSAQNPSAAMRDGFCCEELAVFSTIPKGGRGPRHHPTREGPGHPRLLCRERRKTWMPGTYAKTRFAL